MNILATTFHDLCFFSNDISRLMLAIARFAQKYAIRVHSDPLAGRGTTHKRPKGSLRGLILRSNNSVARLSSRLREKIYTAAARIDLHHSKGFMGLGQNRQPNRLNLGDALAKSGRSPRLRRRGGRPQRRSRRRCLHTCRQRLRLLFLSGGELESHPPRLGKPKPTPWTPPRTPLSFSGNPLSLFSRARAAWPRPRSSDPCAPPHRCRGS